MITHYFKTIKDDELKTIEAPRNGVWTHVVAPSEDELAEVIKLYGLDPAIVEDSKDFFEVPRVERSGSATYFFIRYPYDDPDEDIDTVPLLIIVGESFVVTVGQREVPQFEAFFTGSVVVHTTQKAKFFIQIMDVLTQSFEQKLIFLRRAVQKERTKLRQIGNREIERLVNYEHELNDLITALVPINNSLEQLTAGNFLQLYSEDVEMMDDLLIANNQLIDSARAVLKTVQNVRTASEAILTNKLNATVQTLTILTIMLTIPTIVASIYGMNVPLPLEHNPLSFWIIMVFILILIVAAVILFRRKEWI